jgi:hypothetical protein
MILMQRLATAARHFLLFQVLRRLQRGGPYWCPPGASWRLRRLTAIHRTRHAQAVGAVLADYQAALETLIREERTRHDIDARPAPRFRTTDPRLN